MFPNKFCEFLPKIELHAHLNGSLSSDTLKQLGCLERPIYEYQKLVNVLEKSERTLEECFELFKVAHNATNNKDAVYFATKSVIKEFAEDNVIYLELRTTPRVEENMSKDEYIESVVKAIKENTANIVVKLLLSIDRRHEQSTSEESLDLIIKMRDKYPNIIKGVDLSGNPNMGEFNELLFGKAKEANLKIAIHCAEVKNDEEVKNILNFGPDRLGHSTFLHPKYGGSVNNWDLYCKLQIPTECCVTSNVVCGTSKIYDDHHVQEWIKSGLPFCLNTDDKGVFNTSLSKEFLIIYKYFNMTLTDLWNISYKSVDYTFASEDEKQDLRLTLEDWKKKNAHLF